MGSAKFTINVMDLMNVLKNGLLVAVAAFLTFVMSNLGTIDFGAYTALVIPIVTLVLDTFVKWAKDNTEDLVVPKTKK